MARNWYPFYVGDYARKTAHLSMLEHGAYRLLLDHYYATGLPLPSDPAKLYRICRARTPTERKAVLSTTAEFFIKDGSSLRSKKCDSELNKSLEYSNSQSAKAKLRHSNGIATAIPRARVPQPQLQSKSSEAKASDADASPQTDFKKIIFDSGLPFLAQRTGKSESTLRPLLGKWCKDRGAPAVAAALIRAQQFAAVEPISFIENIFKENPNATTGKSHSGLQQPNKTDRAKAAIHRAAEAGGFATDEGPRGEESPIGDAVSVFPNAETLREGAGGIGELRGDVQHGPG